MKTKITDVKKEDIVTVAQYVVQTDFPNNLLIVDIFKNYVSSWNSSIDVPLVYSISQVRLIQGKIQFQVSFYYLLDRIFFPIKYISEGCL